jgi:hypothetical protein
MIAAMHPLFRLLFFGVALLLISCGSKPSAGGTVAADGPLQVQQLAVRRDGDHLLVRATVHFTNKTDQAVRLRSEAIGLHAGGEIIPAFTRPFNEYPNVEPGTSGVSVLDYWAEPRQVAQELRLKYQEQSLTIKTAGEFNIQQLPEGKLVFLSWPAWQVR